MTRRRAALLGLAALGVLGLVIVALSFKPIVRALVLREARQNGLELSFDELQVRWGQLQARDVLVLLDGVDGAQGRISLVTVELDGLHPKAISASGVQVLVQGSVPERLVQLGGWAKAYPSAVSFPLKATGVQLSWLDQIGQKPWLSVQGATVLPQGQGAVLQAPSAQIAEARTGAVGAVWQADSSTVRLGIGSTKLEQAPIRLDVWYAQSPAPAKITIAPTPLSTLGPALGLRLGSGQDWVVEASADLQLASKLKGSPIEGKVQLSLKGYVPPHPKELNGIVFGDKTTFQAGIHLSEDRRLVRLTDVVVTAGAFQVAGTGQLDRLAEYATVQLALAGAIPCTALARSAAVSHLGGTIGGLLGDVARQTLTGVVNVTLSVKADTRDLASAQVSPSARLACGLKFP